VPGFVQQIVCALLTAATATTVTALTRKRLLVERSRFAAAGRLTPRAMAEEVTIAGD
jgi:hypothetical protein